MNEIDISELIITKALHKSAEDIKATQAHVVLAEKSLCPPPRGLFISNASLLPLHRRSRLWLQVA